MKKRLPLVLLLLAASCGLAEQRPADDLLAMVRERLPVDPIRMAGSLKVKAPNNYTKSSRPVEIALDWGAAPPRAQYTIGGEALTITWHHDVPAYLFSDTGRRPTDTILDSGITWADLSFSVLWWPGSRLVGEERKLDRDCYVVEVPVPGSTDTMRLWIDKKMGMLLESLTLDAGGKTRRRMKIISIRKADDLWVAKDLEIKDYATGNRTLLQITDVERIGPKTAPDGPEGPPVAAFDAAGSINRFALDLYGALSKGEGNLFFSPCSIAAALAMTYGGARGETEEQMADTIHFGVQDAVHPSFGLLQKKLNAVQEKGHVQLAVANSLWPEKSCPFLDDYLTLTKKYYGAAIEPLDFIHDAESARQTINQWVEKQTQGRIRDLIPGGALDDLTRLVLANAIYFKGIWANPFDEKNTRSAPFMRADGTEIQVPMMSQTAAFNYAAGRDFQVIELPYEGQELSMLVFQQLSAEGPAAWELPLTSDALQALEFHEERIMVQLPRFKTESSFGLGDTLRALGMPLAFDAAQADFSGMVGSRGLFISAVFHKAFVEVNEEGTEAAAATAVVVGVRSMPRMFVVNRPFLFLIRENSTGTILFMGRVTDPSAQE